MMEISRMGEKFKAGDRVKCISIISDYYNPIINLTFDKVYEIYEDSWINYSIDMEVVYVRDDTGGLFNYGVKRFIKLSDHRSNVIDEILI